MEQPSTSSKKIDIIDEFRKNTTDSANRVLTLFFQPHEMLSQKAIKTAWDTSKLVCIALLVFYFLKFENISAISTSMIFGVVIGAINRMANSNRKGIQPFMLFSSMLWFAVFIANVFGFNEEMQLWLALASFPSGVFGYYGICVYESR
jgi:hypothetical protein